MNTVYLNVPFELKNLAKELGARWSSEKKQWYMINGSTLESIFKWFPEKIIEKKEYIELTDEMIIYKYNSIPCRFKSGYEVVEYLKVNENLVYVKDGFCGYCDSTLSGEWAFNGKTHLHHSGRVISDLINAKEMILLNEYMYK